MNINVHNLLFCLLLGGMTACASSGSQLKRNDIKLGEKHGLNGRIYDVAKGKFIDETVLLAQIDNEKFVLLGEKHDNPKHHLIQARIVRKLQNVGAVTLEMLRVSQANRIAQTKTAEELNEAVDWANSGWPDFNIYAPLFQRIYEKGLKPNPGNPSRAELMKLMHRDTSTAAPLDAEAHARLSQDIERAHCGYVQGKMVSMMVAAQIHKDRTMAHELRSQSGSNQGVLIAGNGHIRKDYGVPKHLAQTVSVALLEVDDAKLSVTEYPLDIYDYVFFTERLDNLDPCAKFKAQLEKMHRKYKKPEKTKHH